MFGKVSFAPPHRRLQPQIHKILATETHTKSGHFSKVMRGADWLFQEAWPSKMSKREWTDVESEALREGMVRHGLKVIKWILKSRIIISIGDTNRMRSRGARRAPFCGACGARSVLRRAPLLRRARAVLRRAPLLRRVRPF
jgi:hypothetical protein